MIDTSRSFRGDRILGAILFEDTMDETLPSTSRTCKLRQQDKHSGTNHRM